MVGNTAEAEDLAQEAFLQLFRKIGNLPRGVGVFHLAASAGGERRADAAAQENACGDVPGRAERAG